MGQCKRKLPEHSEVQYYIERSLHDYMFPLLYDHLFMYLKDDWVVSCRLQHSFTCFFIHNLHLPTPVSLLQAIKANGENSKISNHTCTIHCFFNLDAPIFLYEFVYGLVMLLKWICLGFMFPCSSAFGAFQSTLVKVSWHLTSVGSPYGWSILYDLDNYVLFN